MVVHGEPQHSQSRYVIDIADRDQDSRLVSRLHGSAFVGWTNNC
jgi:hypothetical protein